MDLTKLVNVKNRGTAKVVYMLPDNGVVRTFMPGEIKRNITAKELEELTYTPGGIKMLEKYLVVNDEELCEYLGITTEPEYFYGDEEVKILLTTGTLEQLLDCLDFAPAGVLDLVKKYAVELKVNSVEKRDAIKEKLSFDVSRAIDNVVYANEKDEDENNSEATSGRRSQPIKAAETTEKRRAAAPVVPQYNRVDK